MKEVKYLILGAGASGLAFANFLNDEDYLVLERDDSVGGYCKTVKQDGFVWDYSGHFFHFRNPDIESMLVERMPKGEVSTIERCSKVYTQGTLMDFPFQKNIHQLPKEDFISCLYDLYFASENFGGEIKSFKDMVYARFGAGIADRFLVPYNEKLYATDLAKLDVEAMGRFFPHAQLDDIIRNMRQADNASYNATFTYPRGGAIEYIYALIKGMKEERILLQQEVTQIDLEARVAHTQGESYRFEYIISSIPFDHLLRLAQIPHQAEYNYNKVLVFNLGFDKKGWTEPHWVYFPDRDLSFYRVGFYDNIFDHDRMSLYIEIGATPDQVINVAEARAQVLKELEKAGVVTDHKLVSEHHVVLDPAYVHVTQESQDELAELRRVLATRGAYTIGRYGSWTYCSIEDNMLEARALAEVFNHLGDE